MTTKEEVIRSIGSDNYRILRKAILEEVWDKVSNTNIYMFDYPGYSWEDLRKKILED